MSDYKQTLNLPQTDFPMKANLAQREPEILKKWQETHLYQKMREQRKGKDIFLLHMGPPYANGHIHMGTALTTTLKDMVVKSQMLNGVDAPLVPGWDCHGMPIELNVEKKVGKPGQKISAAEFRKECREYAQSFVDAQRKEFKRLGILADWENPYLTMNYSYEANEIRSLAKIIEKGHLQKGYKPVHWCLDCASALAEAEVEYADKTSPAIDVRFVVLDENKFNTLFANQALGAGRISIPIWTTTPWTLPANQAVALNPKIEYALVACQGERLLIADSLVESAMQRYGIADYKVLAKIVGAKLEALQLQHPFYQRHVPVVLGEHVTVESGTGAVHTAPAHGQDDYIIGRQYNLPLDNPVGDDGCFIAETPLFAGVHVNKVNEKVLEELRNHDTLLCLAKITHSYPHCWRHKTALIFRATPQWFISMEQKGLRQMALKAIDRVSWVPDWGKSRITAMIENRPDWCISRQRTWGVPLSLFLHRETGEPHPRTAELMEEVAKRVEQKGIEAWYEIDIQEFLGSDADQYIKSRDTLDVWFDSGVSHECVLKDRPGLKFPADMYLEGSDQHRGWFQSSLLTSLCMNDEEPFKTVLTHGYVVDGQGRKMSKSLGNVMLPDEVVQVLGADILRLWVASVDYRAEINVSKEILARISESYRRIRNTARFLLANLHGFDPAKDLLPPEEMVALDRWAVDKTRLVQQEIKQAYDNYQFHVIYQRLHHFCAIELGSFYLDIIKDRQYTMPTNSKGRRSVQTAMFHILEALVRWMAPILSFTAEEIWQFMPGTREDSVFLATWYTHLAALPIPFDKDQTYWEKIRLVRDAVNKEIESQRNAGHIGSALEAEVTLFADENTLPSLTALAKELRFVLITSEANVFSAKEMMADAVATEIPGLWVKVTPTTYVKCERCWHRRFDVGSDAAHPGLCGRCIENVSGTGEVRLYA